MPSTHTVDQIDARILLALSDAPRATVLALAADTGLSRNTVQARLNKLEMSGALRSFERRIVPSTLGYPLQAFVLTHVTQRKLTAVSAALAEIPEVLEVHGLTGVADLLVHVVARDADDLYRIAGQILDIKGVKRTNTALVMRELVDYRIQPLVAARAESIQESRDDSATR
ncbi:Lrp/AsnC family transcriptional regulator [Nocardia altamirensis]|uniref:Lrp/AsnC family transcriptional regulator n=1 Tax=Nocardia altamirensis TaxID=472158 RepID=UPI0008402501|nr:Lrp/AsnC family transcriptional regulator [Nocardia altamirensis]